MTAKRPQVGAVVHVSRPVDLLGAHVVRRSEQRAGFSEVPRNGFLVDDLRDAEIENLGYDGAVTRS